MEERKSKFQAKNIVRDEAQQLFVNERKGEWKRGDVLLRCERNAL